MRDFELDQPVDAAAMVATNWPTPDEVVPEIVVAKIAAVVVIVAAVAYLWVKVTPPG